MRLTAAPRAARPPAHPARPQGAVQNCAMVCVWRMTGDVALKGPFEAAVKEAGHV